MYNENHELSKLLYNLVLDFGILLGFVCFCLLSFVLVFGRFLFISCFCLNFSESSNILWKGFHLRNPQHFEVKSGFTVNLNKQTLLKMRLQWVLWFIAASVGLKTPKTSLHVPTVAHPYTRLVKITREASGNITVKWKANASVYLMEEWSAA